MAETPAATAATAAVDPREQPIFDKLTSIRDRLLVLKQDKTTYIKSRDIVPCFDEVVEQLRLVNDIRLYDDSKQNEVDVLLDSCFQLISLFFLTIGRNNEAPAIYSITSTLKRLADHLKECGVFSLKDLDSGFQTLESMENTLKRCEGSYPKQFMSLLENRIKVCHTSLYALQAQVNALPKSLLPTHEKLVSILRSISSCNTRQKFPVGEVISFQDQLKQIEATTVDGRFIGVDGTYPEPQEVVQDILKRCFFWADMVYERRGKIDPLFQEPYAKLIDVRNQLEKISLTQAWSLRETDLYTYQQILDKIDESRVNGNFLDANGNPADLHAQRTLLYLLRRSYSYIFGLLISSEPVSEALQPVYNQLQTLRRCLIEVRKSGGVSSPRELYPYSMKLTSIDNMRVDGKFMVGSDIPEGQGQVNDLLAECFDMLYELRVEAEENENKSSDEDGQ